MFAKPNSARVVLAISVLRLGCFMRSSPGSASRPEALP